ncbi:MAG: HAMP domain-containing histidine kinase [Anaerolineae bacterium]|nr:HAMP domain-containing histidine kinase [Anaerolineae bacterium]
MGIYHEAPDATPALLRPIVNTIIAETGAQLVQIYSYTTELQRLDLLAESFLPSVNLDQKNELPFIINQYMIDGGVFTLLENADLESTGFESGALFLLDVNGERIGAVGVFPSPSLESDEMARLMNWVNVIQALLENRILVENQAAAHTIQLITEIQGQNPSLQELINILHDSLCGSHITLCVMMLFGPLREDRPNGPFDYMEIMGSWFKRRGSGIGLGIRLYLDQYADLLTELEDKRVLSIPDFDSVADRIDPLIRAFVRAERVRSLVLVSLGTPERRLGVIALATSRPYEFTTSELRGYQMVSKFLAANAMARVLQQQHDFVQRARAALLEAVSDGVLMVLPNDGAASSQRAHSHVLTVNQSFSQMFKISPAQAQGLSLVNLLERMQIPEDVCRSLEHQWISVPARDTMTQRGEFNMVHPHGYQASIEWYSAPVYQEQRVIGRIYTFHDQTAENTAAKLRVLLIARLSHELRTPLTSINGFAQIILEQIGDDLPPLAREYTQIILKSTRHLNAVFSDIIELVRADTGEMPLNMEVTHLPDLIINVAALLELQHKARGQQLVLELDDDLPHVLVDPNRITQVLSNLLGNAIKYAPPDSRIHISTAIITTIRQLPTGAPPDVVIPCVLAAVADEGTGLLPEEAEQVFLPFYRGVEAGGGKVEGTGLGLTIARSIIELHRGKIWAEPRRRGKKGTRFLFTLPIMES